MATRYEKIRCQEGDHSWDWPIKRGRKPANCPAHPAQKFPEERAGPSEASIKSVILRVRNQHTERGLQCKCDFGHAATWEDLRGMGGGCSQPAFVCATLDAIRRQVDKLR